MLMIFLLSNIRIKKYPYRMAVAYTRNIGVGNKDRKELVEKPLYPLIQGFQ